MNTSIKLLRFLFLTTLLCSSLTFVSSAANASAEDLGLELAPVRYELEIKPGSEKTVVVNAFYRNADDHLRAPRVIATLSDWTIDAGGTVVLSKGGSLPDSSCSWMIHSPVEFRLVPNSVQPIRVTISVPPGTASGEYRGALVVEERPQSNKELSQLRTLNIRYRFAILFYIAVPERHEKGELTGLEVEAAGNRITATPILKNEGNVHLRPVTKISILNSLGKVAFERPPTSSTVLLAGAQLREAVMLETSLGPGDYQLLFTVDFGDKRPEQTGKRSFQIIAPAK